ncbi:MAG: EamA family transporter [Proteobacteria bacterium]|nr:EamA family transporter [Pseudomonadota bacterium]
MLRPTHLVALIGINVIFAGAYIAGKFGVNHFPPLFFSGARFLLVFLALLPFFRWHPVPRTHLKPFLGFCFSMGIGVYASMYLALSLADGVSGILIGTQFSVPMAALLGMWWLKDKISQTTWLGIILAFVGVMIVGFDGAILGYGFAFSLIILSAFFYASANVLSQKLSGKVSVLNLNAWMALLSAPPMFLCSLLFEQQQWQALTTADSGDWAALLYSALVVTLVGHCGMFVLLRRYPVALIMPYYVLVPIFGVIGSIVMFSETPTLKFYLGAVIALSGVWVVNVIGKRRRLTTA